MPVSNPLYFRPLNTNNSLIWSLSRARRIPLISKTSKKEGNEKKYYKSRDTKGNFLLSQVFLTCTWNGTCRDIFTHSFSPSLPLLPTWQHICDCRAFERSLSFFTAVYCDLSCTDNLFLSRSQIGLAQNTSLEHCVLVINLFLSSWNCEILTSNARHLLHFRVLELYSFCCGPDTSQFSLFGW